MSDVQMFGRHSVWLRDVVNLVVSGAKFGVLCLWNQNRHDWTTPKWLTTVQISREEEGCPPSDLRLPRFPPSKKSNILSSIFTITLLSHPRNYTRGILNIHRISIYKLNSTNDIANSEFTTQIWRETRNMYFLPIHGCMQNEKFIVLPASFVGKKMLTCAYATHKDQPLSTVSYQLWLAVTHGRPQWCVLCPTKSHWLFMRLPKYPTPSPWLILSTHFSPQKRNGFVSQ